ncbi:putative uncharacterized membrane protein [Phaeomoniella chlamydospora]|uniref:Uncharacterized membrane protein n=1 Tax=Phaeomoniella chlamydospora TaxID=158046 RepID=A0A0G2FYQ2_PHACM|nr:putative uncharacterized membrane protein [Phaeomoniella chlamydospora]
MSSYLRDYVIEWPIDRCVAIWDMLRTNKLLWRRMVKVVIATTAADAIMLIPSVEASIGKAAYLAGITTAFGHPGRRFGQMVEALVLVAFGTLLATAWSALGLYLGGLLIYSNPPAGYTIRALFLVVALFLHGFFRSYTPRVFLGTVLFIIVNVVNLVSTTKTLTISNITNIIYPIFIAIGLLVCVNLFLFPEFSSAYLGGTVTSSLQEVATALRDSGDYFIRVQGSPSTSNDYGQQVPDAETIKPINSITASKAKIRAKLTACKATQNECNFELAYSTLPPRSLKNISQISMSKITMNVIAIISACESKYALLGDEDDLPTDAPDLSKVSSHGTILRDVISSRTEPAEARMLRFDDQLELIKPKREIESGDPELLRYFITQISKPYEDLQSCIDRSIDFINACICYAYHVPELPSGIKAPAGIAVEEVDLQAETMRTAIDTFDDKIQKSLDSNSVWSAVREEWPDVMPREEIFLISSFYLNIRQAATQITFMLDHSRYLVDAAQTRRGRRRLYAPRISWRKWLRTGGGEDQNTQETTTPNSLQSSVREKATEDDVESDDDDDEMDKEPLNASDGDPEARRSRFTAPRNIKRAKSLTPRLKQKAPISKRIRANIADIFEGIQYSADVQYALKVTIACFLVLWPAFVAPWNAWFSTQRGLWAALQLVLITEPTVGNSVQTFILRAFGTTLGCLWGWAAYEAGNGNRIVCGSMIGIGLVPAAYVLLGSKYVKAGIVTSISITVVALATEVSSASGTATQTFLRRFLAFTIGAAVALAVQLIFLPVKARTRMVDNIASCLRQIQEMQSSIAFGIEQVADTDITAHRTVRRFEKASSKAKVALQAAEGYMPFCSKEPRLKGPFDGPLLVYKEIAFVLHQIVDRMENMFTLRSIYGSGPLQRYNAKIFPYRRNIAASIIIILFSVHEALTTHLPLPQFMPSARLAQIRLINRVREMVRDEVRQRTEMGDDTGVATRKHAIRRNFLSWNAGQMAQAEVVEYLEELVDLAKLLVGANEFRTGLLFRPSFQEHIEIIGKQLQRRRERRETVTSPTDVQRTPDAAIMTGIATPATAKATTPEPTTGTTTTLRKVHTTPTAMIGITTGVRRRRTSMRRDSRASEDAEIPYSLKRIQTKKFESVLKRQRTLEEEESEGKRQWHHQHQQKQKTAK